MALLLLLGILPPAVILIALRFTIPSSSAQVAPERTVRPPVRVSRRPARLLVRDEDDEAARWAAMRDRSSIDRRRFGDGPPRTYDSAAYDIWRRLR
jgi:hypothetical protein